MRIGIVGYGAGGKWFHAPFIAAADGVELVGVVARSAGKKADVEADFPGTPTFDSLTDLLSSGLLTPGVDAVVITTPPQTRRELVLEAIEAGVHVVADKPFAPTAAAGRELAEAARAKGVVLSVFHNRRFDADIRTVKKVVESGRVGDVWRFHSRMDLDDPNTLDAGPDGGLLRDLGSHVADQAVWLFGDVTSVSADLDEVTLPEGPTDASFVLTLRHASGVTSYLSASKLNHLQVKAYRVYGSAGSYESSGTDVQAQQVLAGGRPVDDKAGWGYEAEELWGTLHTSEGDEKVPSEQGATFEFYEQFAAATRGEGAAPSPADEGVRVLAVLDAARRSAASGAWEAVEAV